MGKNNASGHLSGMRDSTAERCLLAIRTSWGLCGVGFVGELVGRLWLPGGNEKKLAAEMSDWAGGGAGGKKDPSPGHAHLAEAIARYFEGNRVSFRNTQVALPAFSVFGRMVLDWLSGVEWGKTVTYKEIAESVGHPGAARAIGLIMSKNPVPLIIPCHRVIKSGGGLGGFSGPGGVKMKRKMLELEGCMK